KEDAFKQGRCIEDIDQDAKTALVDEAQGRMHDADMFGVYNLEALLPFSVDLIINYGKRFRRWGVASIATSSSSLGTIFKHLFNFEESSSATLACSYSASFCFLPLSCSSSYLALLELPLVTSA
nr:hypothetical protein [Tanacetum cinerariifolium]